MSVKNPYTPYLLLHVLTLVTAEVVLVSSVEQEGRAAACPGELVIFTCTVIQGLSLNWASTVFTCDDNPRFVLAASTSVGDTACELWQLPGKPHNSICNRCWQWKPFFHLNSHCTHITRNSSDMF